MSTDLIVMLISEQETAQKMMETTVPAEHQALGTRSRFLLQCRS